MAKDFSELLSELRLRVKRTQGQVSELTGQVNSTPSKTIPNGTHNKVTTTPLQIEESAIYKALLELSSPLANSYLQVKLDIEDRTRTSWAGTAHEIREVLATMLRLLAPDQLVLSQKWFVQEPKTSGPTQKQRVRCILEKYGAGSKEREVVEQVGKLEEMIGDIVRATYSRASDAAHTFKARKEVLRIIKYFDVFAHDLLNLD